MILFAGASGRRPALIRGEIFLVRRQPLHRGDVFRPGGQQQALQAAVLERSGDIGMAVAEVVKLWDIVEIGIEGYVIGRSA